MQTGSEVVASEDRMPIGVLRIDEAFEVCRVNRRFLSDFSCRADDVVGVELTELIASSDRRAAIELDRQLNSQETREIDMLLTLEVDDRRRLSRLTLHREGARWVALVEVIDTAGNLVRSLFVEKRRWSATIMRSSDAVVILDAARRIVDFNARFFKLLNIRTEHGVLLGESAVRGRELLALPELAGGASELLRAWLDGEAPGGALTLRERWFELELIQLSDLSFKSAAATGCALIFRDITDRRSAEAERARRQAEQLAYQEQIIDAHKRAIRSLRAPVLPIARDVLVVPLVGELDRERSREIVETVLEAVTRAAARIVILDLTGVPALDEAGVNGVVLAIRAVRLIGARAVLTGLSSTLARALAEDEVSLAGVEVHLNLRDAVAKVL